MKKDKTLGSQIDLIVLAALDRDQAHGYALIAYIRDVSDGFFDFPEGTIYPVLHSLEVKGLIASEWAAPVSGRKRRIYQLTDSGRLELAGKRALWYTFSNAVDRLLSNALPLEKS